jgi:hypothetical protein
MSIEQLRPGDLVLSRSEHESEGPVEAKVVEEVFIRTAAVLTLQVGGQRIGTTAEHPFWVRGKGWTPAGLLQPGDLLSSHDGRWTVVEAVTDAREVTTVYNVCVAEHHTYFVGCQTWGFSVWAHNAEYEIKPIGGGKYGIFHKDGRPVIDHGLGAQRPFDKPAQAQAFIDSGSIYRRLPENGTLGTWVKGRPGDGVYRSTDPRVIDAVTPPGKPRPTHVDIPFEGGNPDFSKHIRELGGVRGETKVKLDVDPLKGQRTRADRDFAKADAWFADQLNQAKVPRPGGGEWNQTAVKNWRKKEGLTWHHHEDMTTMQLIHQDLNDFVAHFGGRSMMDEMFTPPLPFRKPK